jgi:hypothetical protein
MSTSVECWFSITPLPGRGAANWGPVGGRCRARSWLGYVDWYGGGTCIRVLPAARGLHSSTFQLNLSRF